MIHIRNIDDNECFKWCLFRYLHLPDNNPGRITKAGKDFVKTQSQKQNFQSKDIHKIEKKDSIFISVFGYENKKNIQSMYQKNDVKENILIYY